MIYFKPASHSGWYGLVWNAGSYKSNTKYPILRAKHYKILSKILPRSNTGLLWKKWEVVKGFAQHAITWTWVEFISLYVSHAIVSCIDRKILYGSKGWCLAFSQKYTGIINTMNSWWQLFLASTEPVSLHFVPFY